MRALVLAALLCATTTARADDAELLGLSIRAQVQVGGEKPAFVLRPQISVSRVRIALAPADGGRTISLRAGRLAAGREKVLTWNQPVGTSRWKATINATYGTGQTSSTVIEFEATVYPPLAMEVTKADVDLEARTITVRLNAPAGRVDLQIYGDNGQVIYEGEQEFVGEDPGTDLVVSWDPTPEGVAVLKINVKGWSQFGFYTGVAITPWELNIPHEDVEFDTGRSNIRPDQAPKLDAALQVIREKIRLYGAIVEIKLYVAGHTDTVGSRPSNQVLSEQRARSIGNYFRRQGIRIPILYQGFGEDVLEVETPDETDEARNRRADYVLGDGPPARLGRMWKRL